jgi:DNA-binding MarR family transcriptional regulator
MPAQAEMNEGRLSTALLCSVNVGSVGGRCGQRHKAVTHGTPPSGCFDSISPETIRLPPVIEHCVLHARRQGMHLEMAMTKVGVTERQSEVLTFIENEIAAGRPSPNTVEIAKRAGYSTGEVSRILDALEHMGYITRIFGRRRNIRLCTPSVKMATDEHLVAELTRRGYLVRKAPLV